MKITSKATQTHRGKTAKCFCRSWALKHRHSDPAVNDLHCTDQSEHSTQTVLTRASLAYCGAFCSITTPQRRRTHLSRHNNTDQTDPSHGTATAQPAQLLPWFRGSQTQPHSNAQLKKNNGQRGEQRDSGQQIPVCFQCLMNRLEVNTMQRCKRQRTNCTQMTITAWWCYNVCIRFHWITDRLQ